MIFAVLVTRPMLPLVHMSKVVRSLLFERGIGAGLLFYFIFSKEKKKKKNPNIFVGMKVLNTEPVWALPKKQVCAPNCHV